MEVKRLTHFVLLAAMLTALVLLGVADSAASIADTSIPCNEVATSASESNSPQSSSATIRIIMRTPPLPNEFEKPE